MQFQQSSRRQVHTRQIQYRCYAREDGLWELEGEMTDTKTHPVGLYERGQVPPGEPIHHMRLTVVVDDAFVVRAVDTQMPFTPLDECAQAVDPMQRLLGASMQRGWRLAIDEALGGVKGCTHLRDLVLNMGTVAWQSIPSAIRHRQGGGSTPDAPPSGTDVTQGASPPLHLGRCISWDVDGPAVARHYAAFAGWEPLRRRDKPKAPGSR